MDFFIQYINVIFRFVTFFVWLIHYYHSKSKIDERNNRNNVILFVTFNLLFVIWNLAMIIFNSFELWLILWCIIILFEYYIVLIALSKLTDFSFFYNNLQYLMLSVVSIPIIIAAILTYIYKNYNPINTVDFYNQIILEILSIFILRKILTNDKFSNFLDSFFIFAGFILYFTLHILASNAVIFGINTLQNYNFSKFATLVSLIFWLGSVFFIWKIRSNHS